MENRNASKNLLFAPEGAGATEDAKGSFKTCLSVPGGVALTSPATTTKYFSGFSAAIAPSFFFSASTGGTLVAQIQSLDQKMDKQKDQLLREIQYTNKRTDDLAANQDEFRRLLLLLLPSGW